MPYDEKLGIRRFSLAFGSILTVMGEKQQVTPIFKLLCRKRLAGLLMPFFRPSFRQNDLVLGAAESQQFGHRPRRTTI